MRDDDFGVWFVAVVLAGLLFWMYGLDSKLRYSMQYDVQTDLVTVEKKPGGCDFMKSPLGRKDCHYEKLVTVTKWGTSTTGKPIVSYNDGKTWERFDPDPGTNIPQNPVTQSVFVSWHKIDE